MHSLKTPTTAHVIGGAASTCVALFAFELLKETLTPGISPWRSALMTIAFAGVYALMIGGAIVLRERQFQFTLLSEVSERRRAEQQSVQLNNELQARLNESRRRTEQLDLLHELGNALQICFTQEEVYKILAGFLDRCLENSCGAIYMINDSRNAAERAAIWDGAEDLTLSHSPDACCALRGGRMHIVRPGSLNLVCGHWPAEAERMQVCMPMQAHGEVLGVVSFTARATDTDSKHNDEEQLKVAGAAVSRTALTLAQLRLREALRSQAVRDPLTGLHNRRFLEECLDREIKRSKRSSSPMAVLMIDIDHFKRFNDAQGHQAGDLLLCELGRAFRTLVRGHDVVCRYGGEEFALVMPDIPPEVALERAEQLRNSAENLKTNYRGQALGPVTISVGLAMFPQHGSTPEALLGIADRALYQAKAHGRNRVVRAGELADSAVASSQLPVASL